jgi:hypothetical protein
MTVQQSIPTHLLDTPPLQCTSAAVYVGADGPLPIAGKSLFFFRSGRNFPPIWVIGFAKVFNTLSLIASKAHTRLSILHQ